MKHQTNEQILSMHTWCDQIVSGLNLFLCNNSIYLLISPVSFKVICETLYGNPATEPLFEEFCEVHCLKRNIVCCDFAWIMVISLIVLSCVIFSFRKRKKLQRLLGLFQASLESAATC